MAQHLARNSGHDVDFYPLGYLFYRQWILGL